MKDAILLLDALAFLALAVIWGKGDVLNLLLKIAFFALAAGSLLVVARG